MHTETKNRKSDALTVAPFAALILLMLAWVMSNVDLFTANHAEHPKSARMTRKESLQTLRLILDGMDQKASQALPQT